MDQAFGYLAIALNVAFLVCFLMLMWQLLLHKKWSMVLLCIFFAVVCGGSLSGGSMLSVGPGYLIALVIGWQEAANWKIQKLMRCYTALFVVGLILFVHSFYTTLSTPPPPEDPKVQAKKRAAAHH
jgi:hypothetical protein